MAKSLATDNDAACLDIMMLLRTLSEFLTNNG